ncbi:hypothetical protein MMC19_002239 [Ptychographa xylographoides]|nr:hypothetical protein [Ptychographa xylographoides]
MSTVPYTPTTPSEGPRTGISEWAPSLPDIAEDESFADLVRDLSIYIEDVIETPHTWEQLRTGPGSQLLKPLITSISDRCHHLSIVSALLVCKWHYSSLEPDDRGILETRARACEIVAWRFLAHLSENELIDYLLYELPPPRCRQQHDELTHQDPSNLNSHKDIVHEHSNPDESSGLLSDLTARYSLSHSSYDPSYAGLNGVRADDKDDDPTTPFIHLNALEIAAVANAKRFLSQRTVQKVINGIWCGDIIFWDSMNAQTKKKARVYNKRKPIDPYTRLRVPKYQKVFEALFFATFLMLYYAVLLERHPERLGVVEILLYVWIAAFAYDEFGEYRDAGTLFYAADFWSLWDLGIIIVGVAFLIISKFSLS